MSKEIWLLETYLHHNQELAGKIHVKTARDVDNGYLE
jgi:hypothetical protein